MLEIEKTFLVKKLPNNFKAYPSTKIKQGYLSKAPSPLRIRQNGNKFELTKKLFPEPGNFDLAEELNIPLTREEFDLLWSLVDRSLDKTRYLMPLGNKLTVELNIYDGPLSGLVFAEVEFESEEQAKSFIAPDWFGKDITDEDFSDNSFLAGKSFEEIKKYL